MYGTTWLLAKNDVEITQVAMKRNFLKQAPLDDENNNSSKDKENDLSIDKEKRPF